MIFVRSLALTTLAVLAASSQAHFVWAEFQANEKRQVAVTFAEAPGDSVLDLMSKVGGRLVTVSKGAGKGVTSKANETDFPWQGTNGVFMGTLDYGVVDHGQGPYMLTYWYKAVARPSQTSQIVGKGLELVAEQRSDHWDVKVYENGKLCPKAEVVWGTSDAEQKASAKDVVSIPIPENPAALPIRANLSIDESGEFQGKKYPTKKAWSTLVLPAVARLPKGADESAYLALQNATQGREVIALRGFACSFVATNGDLKADGTVTVDKDGKVSIETPNLNGDAAKHVQGQVRSLFAHRLGGTFWTGEGKYPLTWSPQAKGLLLVNDKMDSCYRLNKSGFAMVQRTFGPKILTLDIKSSVQSPWGGFLSKEYDATERATKDGKITSKLHYKDDFLPFQDEWMPKSRIVTGEMEGKAITMSVMFSDYRRL